MKLQTQLNAALTMLVGAMLILVLSMFVSGNVGMLMIGFCICVVASSVALSLWVSRKNVRQLSVYLACISFGVFSLWGTINFLDWLSFSRHGDVGPGGGFSVVIGGVFLSIAWTVLLLLSTLMAHKRFISTNSPTWPVSLNHVVAFILWFSILLVWGANV